MATELFAAHRSMDAIAVAANMARSMGCSIIWCEPEDHAPYRSLIVMSSPKSRLAFRRLFPDRFYD